MTLRLLLAAMVLAWPSGVQAEIALGGKVTLSFATVAEGRKVLAHRDEFVERLSPFDRSSRLQTDEEVTEERYLEFVGKNILAWENEEKEKIKRALANVQKTIAEMALPFPENLFLIKTTGKEEGGAAYTRGNAIVLPQGMLGAPEAGIRKTVCHELFHILSRANAELREKCYAAIGFENCGEIPFPEELQSRKLTNPDAPMNAHCIRVKVDKEDQWVVPILFSRTEKYNVERGQPFFWYLEFRMVVVQRLEGGAVKLVKEDGKAKLVHVNQVTGFHEQVGKNTGYIIHPEEILADNFALLVLGAKDLPSPEVVEKLATILGE